ncbi:phosphoheptose isomerase [Candidatus Woesearchaeota archaeon]|nr:phosphoheptose isomerase [Candidatus Woesearchaeota archaeon]
MEKGKPTFFENKGKSPQLCNGITNFIIDLDGVVCEDIPNEEPERMANASEIPDTKEQINKWYETGHIITFFTSRTEEHRNVTEKWLSEHGFRYHNIIFCKPRGGNYFYIDDKQIAATRFLGSFNGISCTFHES